MRRAAGPSWWQCYVPVVACYLAWVVLSAGAFWAFLRCRDILVTLAVMSGIAAKIVIVLDRWGFVPLGMIWIVVIVAMESYLSAALRTGRLRQRIVRVAAAEAGLLGASYVVQWLLLAAARA